VTVKIYHRRIDTKMKNERSSASAPDAADRRRSMSTFLHSSERLVSRKTTGSHIFLCIDIGIFVTCLHNAR